MTTFGLWPSCRTLEDAERVPLGSEPEELDASPTFIHLQVLGLGHLPEALGPIRISTVGLNKVISTL